MVVDQLDASLAALADPTRRAIVDRLRRGPATVGELAAPFRMTQQAVSKHLARLEEARLIRKTRRGRRHVCTLDAAPIKEVVDWAERYRRFWEESFDRLDDYLRELQVASGSPAGFPGGNESGNAGSPPRRGGDPGGEPSRSGAGRVRDRANHSGDDDRDT